jgi:ribosomal protein S5
VDDLGTPLRRAFHMAQTNMITIARTGTDTVKTKAQGPLAISGSN